MYWKTAGEPVSRFKIDQLESTARSHEYLESCNLVLSILGCLLWLDMKAKRVGMVDAVSL